MPSIKELDEITTLGNIFKFFEVKKVCYGLTPLDALFDVRAVRDGRHVETAALLSAIRAPHATGLDPARGGPLSPHIRPARSENAAGDQS